jgi:hypothetical protein
MKRNALSTRERWLLALLPAALVLIGSSILPSGKTERRQLNAVLSNAPGDEEMHRELAELTRTIGESRAEVRRIEEELAQLRQPTVPDRQATAAALEPATLAGRFEQLGERLDGLGIAIMSTEAVGRSGSSAGDTTADTWKLTVASTWPQLTDAMARSDLMPAGLIVDSIAMDPPRNDTHLRRWVIMLSISDRSPTS